MSRQDTFVARDAKGPSGARIQYGALCWRPREGGVEVMLITSRDTGRWVIPKGWPMAGLAPEAAAAQEAWEEAGVKGTINPVCLGRFGYMKCLTPEASVPCAVAVYGLRVESVATKYPEIKARNRQWFGQAEAATLVDESELRRLIEGFVPPPEGRARPIGADEGAPVKKPKSKR
jgi:8-oxo-dGTP pyrophosphatase MutT (NUDIX family)